MKRTTQNFVLEALKPNALKNPASLSPSIDLNNIEWDHALNYSEAIHARIPLLYFLKRSNFFSLLPSWVQEQTESSESRMRMSLALFDEELNSVATLLAKREIPLLVLKGMELGVRCYPSRLLRPMNDIDLLIPIKHYERVVQMLRRCGYQFTADQYPGRFRTELSRHPESPIVELHFYLAESDNAKTIRAIWERSVAFSLPEIEAPLRVMNWEDSISYLIRHAAVQHLVESPVWLNDVAFVLEKAAADKHTMDWDRIVYDLRERKNRIASVFFLRLLQSYCDFSLPKRVVTQFGIRGPSQKVRLFLSRISYEKFFRKRSWFFVLKFRTLLKDSLYQTFLYVARRQLRKWLEIQSPAEILQNRV